MPLLGLDLLGLASPKWKIKQTINALPFGVAIGLFADDTFGHLAIQNTKKLLATGRVKAVRAQMHWDYGHKIVPLPKLQKLLPAWEALAKEWPTVKFYISHSCEYNEPSVVEIRKRTDLVRALAPSCIVVQTPMHSPVIPGFIVEVHGQQSAKPGQIASTDGEALFDMDAEKWAREGSEAEILFAWGPRCNGAEAHNTLPPTKRTAFPDKKYLLSLLRLLHPSGTAPSPTFSGKVTPFKRPILLKTHGEDLQGKNARDNKPLIIVQPKARFAQILTFNGKVIGKMPYWGGYPPNLSRYYAGLPGGLKKYGYEIAEKAKAVSGSEFVWFKVGKKIYGPAHPAFRIGYFQS